MTLSLCQDPSLPVEEAFCPLPKNQEVNSLALSLLFIWAHYPDLSVTGFVTLRSPIREAGFCCTSHKLFIPHNFLLSLPQRGIEMDIRETTVINVRGGVSKEALVSILTYCLLTLRPNHHFLTFTRKQKTSLDIQVQHFPAF